MDWQAQENGKGTQSAWQTPALGRQTYVSHLLCTSRVPALQDEMNDNSAEMQEIISDYSAEEVDEEAEEELPDASMLWRILGVARSSIAQARLNQFPPISRQDLARPATRCNAKKWFC